MKLIVIKTPWPTQLPNGTEVVKCEPRIGKEDKQWFKRADGELLFEEDKDGKFCLWDHEYNKIQAT